MRRAAALFAPIALLAAGCGGNANSHGAKKSANATGGPVKTVTIEESEFKLSPSHVSLAKPGTYVFKGVNKGTVGHALALEGSGVDQKSATVGAGNSITLKVTITKPGSYELYCPVDGHKGRGMKATVTLGRSTSGTSTQPATQAPSGGRGY